MHANSRDEIKEVRAGDIAAAVGLKSVTTGDTLCDLRSVITLERMEFPDPVISVAVEPQDQGRSGKNGYCPAKTGSGRSVFPCYIPMKNQARQLFPAWVSLHLDILVDRMKREFKVEANVGRPQVAYRETDSANSVEAEGKFVKQVRWSWAIWTRQNQDDANQVKVTGYEFENQIVGGSIPKEYIGSVDKGIQEAMQNGVGCRISRWLISGWSCIDGSYHDVDSNPRWAFKVAGSMAFKECCAKTARPSTA